VITDNPLSLQSAERIQAITESLDNRIGRKYLVTNAVKEGHKAQVLERAKSLRLEYLVDIPYDPALDEVVFRGEPLKKLDGSPIMNSIARIIDVVGGVHANS
jgi:CO dehydrogenase nickel-insertion accessory protein CooC1